MKPARNIAALVVAALACLPLSACKKQGNASSSNSALKYLPVETASVAGIQLEVLLTFLEEKVPDYDPGDLRRGLMSESAEMKLIAESCDLDPLSIIKSITVGFGKDLQDLSQRVIVVATSFTEERANSCFEAMKGKGYDLHAEKEGKFTAYRIDGTSYYAWWPTEHTVVWVEAESAAPLSTVADGGKSALDNPTLGPFVEKTNTGALFWFAGLIPADPKFQPMLAKLGETPTAAYAWINITGAEMDAKVALTFADEDAAKRVYDKAKVVVGLVKGTSNAFDELDLSLAGREAIATAKFDSEAIAALRAMTSR